MSVSIDGYDIDVFVTEEHSHECEVTELPIESGSDVSDHVRVKPDSVSVEGIVSDTPIGRVSEVRQPDFDAGLMPSDAAYDYLKRLRSERRTFVVVTSRAVYDSMVFQSLNVTETADNGDILRFRAVFKQIVVRSNARATVPVATPRGRGKVKRGHKPAEKKEELLEGSTTTTFSMPRNLLYNGVGRIREAVSGD